MVKLELAEAVEEIAQRAVEDPQVAKLVENAQWYAHLKEDPGWLRLERKILEESTSLTLALAKRLLAGEHVEQREIDTQRGFFLGALYAIRHPEKAEEGLRLAGKIAWEMVADELQVTGEDEPYA